MSNQSRRAPLAKPSLDASNDVQPVEAKEEIHHWEKHTEEIRVRVKRSMPALPPRTSSDVKAQRLEGEPGECEIIMLHFGAERYFGSLRKFALFLWNICTKESRPNISSVSATNRLRPAPIGWHRFCVGAALGPHGHHVCHLWYLPPITIRSCIATTRKPAHWLSWPLPFMEQR